MGHEGVTILARFFCPEEAEWSWAVSSSYNGDGTAHLVAERCHSSQHLPYVIPA